MVTLVVLEEVGFTVRFKVASESHPKTFAPESVTKYVPAALKLLSLKTYGNAVLQMVTLVVLEEVGFTVKFKVANESQPNTFAPARVTT